jgi:hypothetical protein
MPRPRVLTTVAIVLAFACVAVVAYKIAHRSANDSGQLLVAPADCDLNASRCAVDLPEGGRIELSISPQPIPVVRPLHIDVRITGAVVHRVELDFSGRTMDMGSNRTPLAPVGEGGYRGSAMLPVCVTGRMDWQATLYVDTQNGRLAARFDFSAPSTL